MTDLHGPLTRYRTNLESGDIQPDPAQEHVVHRLDALARALPDHDRARRRPAEEKGAGLMARVRALGRSRSSSSARSVDQSPRGLYIHGAVGRGKSMLMDLFHSSVPLDRKRRAHFHELMREVHETLHRWRQEGREGHDPLIPLADRIAADVSLLCLDEMEVRDIADAMIVARLFERLLENGVVVVTTSNRPPRDLYKDGLQREKFLPFIALLETRLDILELDAAQDYRLGRLQGRTVYHHPLGPDSDAALEETFRALLDGAQEAPDSVAVHGRVIPVPRAGNGAAWFTFEDLCERPLGVADYLEIATLYDVVLVSGIPVLGPEGRDKARRLVLLVDALYDHRTALICSADAPPQNLYRAGDGVFEFDRTVSRLIEMQAKDYLGRAHRIDRGIPNAHGSEPPPG
ncbi:cell division protein ZapE [Rhodospira trueperi]|uniref:Cell division protein ZapE n=1 Tax=Rhodospira trueperi TaxID=69960 RepID=A0A1G6WXW4_9PROT|nr:cell division protein ZapE [Rhodospira trueperi]SDD70701.1 cell division protein ZapE [Rhodospira trueperi]